MTLTRRHCSVVSLLVRPHVGEGEERVGAVGHGAGEERAGGYVGGLLGVFVCGGGGLLGGLWMYVWMEREIRRGSVIRTDTD